MPWQQVIDPLGNSFLSVLFAVLPILFIFWALVVKKMKGYLAAVLTLLITIFIAILVYKMPVKLALLSAGHGALYGLFPICWIIVSAVFLFNLVVKSGQFEVIRHYMSSVTEDRRLQALLIAFSFGAFLEGTAGFGTPVAITAAMLAGLGFQPLYAAGICLIANTAPVAFGSIGIPIAVASQVSGLPEMAISQMVGRTLPILSLLLPFYLVILMSGFRKAIEIWPAILISGGSFAFFQWFSSNYLGPALPDIIASLASIVSLVVFLRFWTPASPWRFEGEEQKGSMHKDLVGVAVFRALSPFLVLTVMVLVWGMIRESLDGLFSLTVPIAGLDGMILRADTAEPISQVFKLNVLSAAGTAVFISAILSIPILGIGWSNGWKIFGDTLRTLRFPILTVASILAFAYLVNNSGMSITLADALAHTGWLFPFFAPVLGWLGVFITGSDTSSNALFSKLQAATARSIGVDPVVTVGANVSGGVVGKMISPQSIAVAAAATGTLVGREADLFRFTVRHSFILLLLICLITLLQAYVWQWIIPLYTLP